MAELVKKVADYVKKSQHNPGGHDWWHVYRVWRTARYLGKKEGADPAVVQLAALLHDLADWKFHGEEAQVKEADKVLRKFGADDGTRRHVLEIISEISFKGSKASNRMRTIEGKVVQDADRLDALGAMGIARVFAYAGHKDMMMHEPARRIKKSLARKEYTRIVLSGSNTAIEHFYQKLLFLKDRMNTKTGRRIAGRRHKIMASYLKEFLDEWKMKDLR